MKLVKIVKFVIWDLILIVLSGIVGQLIHWKGKGGFGFPWLFHKVSRTSSCPVCEDIISIVEIDYQAFIYDFIFWGLIVLAIWLIARQQKTKS